MNDGHRSVDRTRVIESYDTGPARPARPADKQVILRRLRFHYLDWGGSENQTIVFLHGGGLTAHSWDIVCTGLRSGFRCLALDLRGHGESEWSPEMDYAISSHAEDLASFIELCQIDRPIVVGMSLGGKVALRYALDHEPLALVLVDAGPVVQDAGRQRIMDFITQPDELGSIEEFVERALAFNPRRDPVQLARSLTKNLMRLPDGKWTWRYDRRHYGRASDEAELSAERRAWLSVRSIQCPTLIIRGAESDVLSHDDAIGLAHEFPNARLVEIPDAGHTVHGDNPPAFIDALDVFLVAVQRSAPPDGSPRKRRLASKEKA